MSRSRKPLLHCLTFCRPSLRVPLGDIVDRRSLVLFTESWMMGVALLLAVLTISGLMSPWLLLVLTFALSAGDAFETPMWRALLPECV